MRVTVLDLVGDSTDFVTNEGSEVASPMGAISVSLQDITEFEMILRMNSVPENNGQATGARFILDFSDPPDNPVIPEVSSLALALIAGAAGLLLLRRRS